MILQLFQILVIRQELFEVFRTGEGFQIDEYRVAVYLSRILHAEMIRVGEHGHDFLLYVLCFIGKIDAVSERLAHFCFAVDTGQTQAGLVGRKDDLRIGQGLAVYGVELVNDLLTLLQHGQLVFAYRYMGSTESRDICSLADGIAEEADRNAGFEITHQDLCLYGRVSLYAGYRYQIHVIEGQLGELGDHGLDKDRGFIRINAAGQIIQSDLNDILTDFLRMLCVVGERLGVCNHNVDLIVLAGVLELYTLRKRTHVMTDMKAAGGTVSG